MPIPWKTITFYEKWLQLNSYHENQLQITVFLVVAIREYYGSNTMMRLPRLFIKSLLMTFSSYVKVNLFYISN